MNRLICEAFNGPPLSSKHEAAHLNGINDDDRADNLAWKTPVENCADKAVHGTTPNFALEANPNVKLDWVKVKDIRHRALCGESLSSIALFYGVTSRTVWGVVTERAWIA
ncbi:MAG: HNH endonuclease [Terriglobales bacterium]